jgi:hypothetical protein
MDVSGLSCVNAVAAKRSKPQGRKGHRGKSLLHFLCVFYVSAAIEEVRRILHTHLSSLPAAETNRLATP